MTSENRIATIESTVAGDRQECGGTDQQGDDHASAAGHDAGGASTDRGPKHRAQDRAAVKRIRRQQIEQHQHPVEPKRQFVRIPANHCLRPNRRGRADCSNPKMLPYPEIARTPAAITTKIKWTIGPAIATASCVSGSSGTRGETSPPTGPSTIVSTFPPTRIAASVCATSCNTTLESDDRQGQQAIVEQVHVGQRREDDRQRREDHEEDVDADLNPGPSAQTNAPPLDTAPQHDFSRQTQQQNMKKPTRRSWARRW